jgi:hypothetical protein
MTGSFHIGRVVDNVSLGQVSVRILQFSHQYHSTAVHTSSGGWTTGLLVATVQRHSLTPSTWTSSYSSSSWSLSLSLTHTHIYIINSKSGILYWHRWTYRIHNRTPSSTEWCQLITMETIILHTHHTTQQTSDMWLQHAPFKTGVASIGFILHFTRHMVYHKILHSTDCA